MSQDHLKHSESRSYDDFADAGVHALGDLDPQDVSTLSSRELGALGELLAASYLEARGYDVLEHSYRCPEGEADLIAYDPVTEEIVLVEVKTRRAPKGDGTFPEEAVNYKKRQRYRRIAACYIMDHFPVMSLRFDVVALTIHGGSDADIVHHIDVFQWEAEQ
ncbi:YraN family protein [Collinsella sp. An2]|uniref:YraN family protein n=1 Tax=Collinsella sp. An2 TaxID=1965585 RepID=UPI000B3A6B9D|nr:YraN family protein [Collinsella sp. An2]OUP08234.1 hypothetical protein B5F33_07420 [Collinsella sp. An2]